MPCSSTCSRKNGPVTRFPTGLPWRSGKATTTVSMAPAAICCRSDSTVSIPELFRGGALPSNVTPARPASFRRHVGSGDAPVHHHRRTGDERSIVRGQEQGGPGDLLGVPEPSDGDVGQSTLATGWVGQELGQQ